LIRRKPLFVHQLLLRRCTRYEQVRSIGGYHALGNLTNINKTTFKLVEKTPVQLL